MTFDDDILALAFDPLTVEGSDDHMERGDHARDLLIEMHDANADNLIYDWHNDPFALPLLDGRTISLLSLTNNPKD